VAVLPSKPLLLMACLFYQLFFEAFWTSGKRKYFT
jgi:hypothetical protein